MTDPLVEQADLQQSAVVTSDDVRTMADPDQGMGQSTTAGAQMLHHEGAGYVGTVYDSRARALSKAQLMQEAHLAMTYLVRQFNARPNMRGLTAEQQHFLKSRPGMGRHGLNRHEYHMARLLFARGVGFRSAQRLIPDQELWDAIQRRQPVDVRLGRPNRRNHPFLKIVDRPLVGARTVRFTGQSVVSTLEHLTTEVRARHHSRHYDMPTFSARSKRAKLDLEQLQARRRARENQPKPENSI